MRLSLKNGWQKHSNRYSAYSIAVIDSKLNKDYMIYTVKRPPTHPGAIIKYDYIEPLSLSITKLAQYLDVSRITVSKIVNERAPVTADMALRLAKTFDTTAELWLGLQKQYDLWHAEHDTDTWQRANRLFISEEQRLNS